MTPFGQLVAAIDAIVRRPLAGNVTFKDHSGRVEWARQPYRAVLKYSPPPYFVELQLYGSAGTRRVGRKTVPKAATSSYSESEPDLAGRIGRAIDRHFHGPRDTS